MAIRQPVFKGTRVSGSNLTTYIFDAANSLDLGTIRPVTVVIAYATNASSRIVNSALLGGVAGVGGVAMTKLQETGSSAAGDTVGFLVATITEADVASGVGAEFRAVLNSGNSGFGFGWWLLYDLASLTPTDSASSTADPFDLDVDVAEGDFALIVGSVSSASVSATPTGYTEDFEATIETTVRLSGGHHVAQAAESPRQIGQSWSTPTFRAGAAIVLRPNPIAPAAAELEITTHAPTNRAAFLTATQAALAQGRHVICPRFVHFAFDDEDIRLWEGAGDIIVGGETWRGVGDLGSISDHAFGVSDAAGNITYGLSGVSAELIALARSESDLVKGRVVTLYGQFLDRETAAPLDDPFVIRIDVMDVLSYAGSGPSERRISLTAETIWTARNMASFAYFSAKDQDARFAGDLGLDFVARYGPGVRRYWPNF